MANVKLTQHATFFKDKNRKNEIGLEMIRTLGQAMSRLSELRGEGAAIELPEPVMIRLQAKLAQLNFTLEEINQETAVNIFRYR